MAGAGLRCPGMLRCPAEWPVPFPAVGAVWRGVRGPPPRVLGRQPWAYLFLD